MVVVISVDLHTVIDGHLPWMQVNSSQQAAVCSWIDVFRNVSESRDVRQHVLNSLAKPPPSQEFFLNIVSGELAADNKEYGNGIFCEVNGCQEFTRRCSPAILQTPLRFDEPIES